MNLFQAAVLGMVQGFAEFLPVSSSGHLVLVQEFFNISQGTVAFDVFLHFATLLAVLIYFRNDLLKLSKKSMVAILVASIPAGIVGILFEDYIVAAFGSVLLVGFALVFTGILNFVTEHKLKQQTESTTQIGNKQAFIIGLFQAFAVLPGISRSGSTVFAGIVQNIDRMQAFRFSFLMSVPVIFGANLLHVSRIVAGGSFDATISTLLLGGSLAFLTGLASLKILELVIVKAKMNYFGVYCIAVGLIVIAQNLL